MDLFRCTADYLAHLLSRADSPELENALGRLYFGKLNEDEAEMVAAVETLFEQLVLVEGRG